MDSKNNNENQLSPIEKRFQFPSLLFPRIRAMITAIYLHIFGDAEGEQILIFINKNIEKKKKKQRSRLPIYSFLPILFLLFLFGILTACSDQKYSSVRGQKEDLDHTKLHITATIFPAYDFARAAGGEWVDVSLLLPPGAESHSYEPTPADILSVQNSDLFLYLGGESDTWVETILESVHPQGAVLRMIDCVDLLDEIELEGMESHESHDFGEVKELDEHVWTSPQNAAQITRMIASKLAELDPEHQADYRSSGENYAQELESLDAKFQEFFDANPANRTLLFGDRFPLRYFAAAYHLNCYAAFPGCSTQTEPSAATIAFLIEKAKSEQVPAVWYIEFSNHLVADAIAEAAGCQSVLFHTCHNISMQELENGETYLSLMEQNLQRLNAISDN